eukprot:298733_1
MKSFFKRVCPKLQFNSTKRILDSLAITYHYIVASVMLIDRIVNGQYQFNIENNSTCPFQMDFCMMYDTKDNIETKMNENPRIPSFKDIEQRLQKEKLIYEVSKFMDDDATNPGKYTIISRKFHELFQKLVSKLPKTESRYPQKRRFCLLVDRRRKVNKHNTDEIVILQPPNNCNSYPYGKYTPLWNFDSSQTCIIPQVGYNNNAKNIDASTLTSKNHCNGSLVIISYHVEAKDQIKCYLYLNSSMSRFYVEDIMEILSGYFIESDSNKKLLKSTSMLAQGLREKLKGKINDLPFERFCDKYKISL